MDVNTLIERAGGIEELAKRLGVHRVTVYDWKRLKAIPANRVKQVSHATGLPETEVLKMTAQVPVA
jgi:transposase